MSRENVEVAEAAYAALDRGDLEAFLEMVHPEVEFGSILLELEGQTYRGHDGVRRWWATATESIGAASYRPETIEGFRDRGITRLRLAMVHEGVEVPQVMWHAWRIREGKIRWWSPYRTESEALEAVGLRE